jgi:ribosome biogenesis GTPase
VLNKADLVPQPEARVAEVQGLAPAVPVHAVSCLAPLSLEVLRGYLGHGRTGALLGSSGAGKSTIVNRLIGYDLLRTRDVRTSDSRGRHTSTSRQLVLLPGDGVLIDTPGMRELQLWETGEVSAGVFEDIEERAAGCRFRDCQHRHEPGCAVRAAVDAGELPAARLASFHKLLDEQQYQVRQQEQRAALEEKRRWKVITKSYRKHFKPNRDG